MSIRRDYKSAATWKNQRKKRLQVRRRALLVIALVGVGLFGSLLAYLSGDKQRAQVAVQGGDSRSEKKSEAQKPNHTERALDLPAPAPKYEFYQRLPKQEVVIRRDELNPPPAPKKEIPPPQKPLPQPKEPAKKPAPAAGPRYVVQAGAFSKQADAERVKASLALLGLRARVELGKKGDKTFHRVRIGPYRDPAQVQALLRDNNIQSILIKVD